MNRIKTYGIDHLDFLINGTYKVYCHEMRLRVLILNIGTEKMGNNGIPFLRSFIISKVSFHISNISYLQLILSIGIQQFNRIKNNF